MAEPPGRPQRLPRRSYAPRERYADKGASRRGQRAPRGPRAPSLLRRRRKAMEQAWANISPASSAKANATKAQQGRGGGGGAAEGVPRRSASGCPSSSPACCTITCGTNAHSAQEESQQHWSCSAALLQTARTLPLSTSSIILQEEGCAAQVGWLSLWPLTGAVHNAGAVDPATAG